MGLEIEFELDGRLKYSVRLGVPGPIGDKH
jgi:hypothetical protein